VVVPDRLPVLAIDIGGTKLAAGLVAQDGTLLRAERTPTGTGADGEALYARLEVLAETVAAGVEVTGVGVGCGGPMTWPSGEVSPLNIPAWRDFPLLARLAARWPGVPVRVHNDAVAVAIAEHWCGAASGYDDVMGMVVSTGVGGGLVLGGRLVDGRSGNAGHVGHVVVDPEGPDCVCGGRGCLEAIARGPAVVAWAVAKGWRRGSDAAMTGRELGADAADGDAVAVAALARAGHALGVGIASATALLDLDLVVVGGGLSQTGGLLFGPLEESLRRHARMAFTRAVRVVPAELGQEAGLVGAAALVLRGDRYWSAD
jgi:glucokinase